MNILEILTVGLPFCAFKSLTGLYYRQYWLVALGIIDLGFNLINLLSILFTKRRMVDACFLSYLIRYFAKPVEDTRSHWEDFGNSLDVLLSFILVAVVIGGGAIKDLSALHLLVWNVGVVLNVLGAGSSRLTTSIRNLKPH